MKPLQRAAVLAGLVAAAIAFFSHGHAAAATGSKTFGVYVNVTTSATASP